MRPGMAVLTTPDGSGDAPSSIIMTAPHIADQLGVTLEVPQSVVTTPEAGNFISTTFYTNLLC